MRARGALTPHANSSLVLAVMVVFGWDAEVGGEGSTGAESDEPQARIGMEPRQGDGPP